MAVVAEPIIHPFYETGTGTWQYLVADPGTKHAVIIDPVLNFDPAWNTISTQAADEILAKVATEGYPVVALLETHIHADHLSAAAYLRDRLQQSQSTIPEICIGNISDMQNLFGAKYCVPKQEWALAFDSHYHDGDTFPIGDLVVEVMHLPGHTPDHLGYAIGRNVFTGDSIFNPDLGSARCDFPKGSAVDLWNTMKRLLSLPEDYKLYTGHDYPPSDRDAGEGVGMPRSFATVKEHKASNKHVKDGTTKSSFIDLRTTRDATLKEPRLINQALQFNIRGGQMPAVSQEGDRLVHIPLRIPSGFATA